jgi:hypothetical protein
MGGLSIETPLQPSAKQAKLDERRNVLETTNSLSARMCISPVLGTINPIFFDKNNAIAWGLTYKSYIVRHKIRKDSGPNVRAVGFYFRKVPRHATASVLRLAKRTKLVNESGIDSRELVKASKPTSLEPGDYTVVIDDGTGKRVSGQFTVLAAKAMPIAPMESGVAPPDDNAKAIGTARWLDHDGLLPGFAVVTESRASDLEGARRFAFAKGSIAIFDKGYSDHAWLKTLDDRGVFFVTRARSNILVTQIDQRAVKRGGNVIFDRRVTLAGKRPREMGMKPLRLVGYICPLTGREYVFLTNIEHLCAQTIADIYKSRWQIELFFKWLKQNLKLKGFLGTSKNAVLSQIWAALCVSLLLAYLKFASRIDLSMQQIARLLQLNLFLKRDLLALLKDKTTPPRSPPNQYALQL